VTVIPDLAPDDVMEADPRRVSPGQRAAGAIVIGAVLLGGGYALHQREAGAATSQAERAQSVLDSAAAVMPDTGTVVAHGTETELSKPRLIGGSKAVEPGHYRTDVVCIGTGILEFDVTVGGTGQARMLRCKPTAMAQSQELDVPEEATGVTVERGTTLAAIVSWQLVKL
jgi:hypothetical protein